MGSILTKEDTQSRFEESIWRNLPRGSTIRRYMKAEGDEKAAILRSMRGGPVTFLVPMRTGIHAIENVTPMFSVADDLEQDWALFEPTPQGWRKWAPSTAIVFADIYNTDRGSVVGNALDEKHRPWSLDTLLLCSIICENENVWSDDALHMTKVSFRRHLRTKLKRYAKTSLAVGFIACATAAAVCTGVGAVTIASEVATRLVSGAVSAAGGDIYQRLVLSTDEKVSELTKRILAIENALLTKGNVGAREMQPLLHELQKRKPA